MAFTELEGKRVEKAVEAFVQKRRPPSHIRPKLDIGFRLKGQSIEIFEIRPLWSDPTKILEESVAKATYVKTLALWKVYWKRADGKWHSYPPVPKVGTVDKFLELVDADAHGFFWG